MSAQNLSGMQFRQDALWGDSGAWRAADRQVRENMAQRVTGAADDPDFVGHMGQSNATRADLLALEHINPTVRQGIRAAGTGSYSSPDNFVEYNPSYLESSTRHTLFHELGHALHMGGQRYGGSPYSAQHNPDPVQEGVADGVAHRMSKGGTGGDWTYRDSAEYVGVPNQLGDSTPEDTILEGGSSWGPEGRAAYEASRALAAAGEMPQAPHWSYRSGTVTQLTRTPGYADTVRPEHQKTLQAAVARDHEILGRNEQQKLF